ncbi:MAG: PilZ domain-containing protein [Myxococcales bacterium]|nr:PilZ domain-containing protein [Myxococcales bacterium]
MTMHVERRSSARIDKVFRVLLSTEETGDQWFVARNISTSGMFVEMADPVPLRTKVIVRFQLPGDDAAICAVARVQNHYYLQYAGHDGLRALSGVGLRFLRFIAEVGAQVPDERLN